MSKAKKANLVKNPFISIRIRFCQNNKTLVTQLIKVAYPWNRERYYGDATRNCTLPVVEVIKNNNIKWHVLSALQVEHKIKIEAAI